MAFGKVIQVLGEIMFKKGDIIKFIFSPINDYRYVLEDEQNATVRFIHLDITNDDQNIQPSKWYILVTSILREEDV